MKAYNRFWWLAGLLTLCLCLALTACDGGEGDVTTPTLAPTEAPTEPATEAPTDTPTEEVTDGKTEAPTDPVTEETTEELTGCEVCTVDDSLWIWILIAIMIVAVCGAAGFITIKVRK